MKLRVTGMTMSETAQGTYEVNEYHTIIRQNIRHYTSRLCMLIGSFTFGEDTHALQDCEIKCVQVRHMPQPY